MATRPRSTLGAQQGNAGVGARWGGICIHIPCEAGPPWAQSRGTTNDNLAKGVKQ